MGNYNGYVVWFVVGDEVFGVVEYVVVVILFCDSFYVFGIIFGIGFCKALGIDKFVGS